VLVFEQQATIRQAGKQYAERKTLSKHSSGFHCWERLSKVMDFGCVGVYGHDDDGKCCSYLDGEDFCPHSTSLTSNSTGIACLVIRSTLTNTFLDLRAIWILRICFSFGSPRGWTLVGVQLIAVSIAVTVPMWLAWSARWSVDKNPLHRVALDRNNTFRRRHRQQ
jgi:hypothetical protein